VCGLRNILIARTGYTGEDGFEIYIPHDPAISEMVWGKIFEAGKEFGILPCGLGARNTLRLESKMALYGHEISDTINVWEACLDRYAKMEKGDFVGRAALEKARTGRVGDGGSRNCARWLQGLQREGSRDWNCDQRIACAVFKEEYRAGLCTAGTFCDWKYSFDRSADAKIEGAGCADTVL
jgi:aminomethyltransferase